MDTHRSPLEITPEERAGLPEDGGSDFNRLIFEESPYLLQHAANPVDWYPWGEEAFQAARERDCPIFLSIGYSTCHWCHVMERESFEDPEVAELLNRHMVCVKVDREERPDVDQLYMTVTQGMTGGGGWPMTVVMTPDGTPFFAGTYFPKLSRPQRPGMVDLVPSMAEAWAERRDEVLESAEEIRQWLEGAVKGSPGGQVGAHLLPRAYQQLAERFDAEWGGFGDQPKFPTPHNLTFLLRFWGQSGEDTALRMVEQTLQSMRRGGIFDHVGFGFHRYSTDRQWLVPHFEKMLYDQAGISLAALETYQATGNRRYARMAREVFTYVVRDMQDPEGGFYSAEDADSEGEEGRFYVWRTGEVEELLGDEAELYMEVHALTPEGNYREESTGERTGRNIPHLPRPMEAAAERLGMDLAELTRRMEAARQILFAAREQRVHPYKDDKVLTDWNGLMIAALARGGRVLGEEAYTGAARRAASFLWDQVRADDGRLLKRWRGGRAGLPAHLDDYAFLTWGLLELYESTFAPLHLERAVELAERMVEGFWDDEEGAFFFTSSEELLLRKKEFYDGALPAGNSVAALTLMRLGRLLARPGWEEKGQGVLEAHSAQLSRSPAAFTALLAALSFQSAGGQEITIAGRPGSEDTTALLDALRMPFLPNAVVAFRPESEDTPDITRLAPYTEAQRAVEGRAAAYVCRNYACERPVHGPEEMLERIAGSTI